MPKLFLGLSDWDWLGIISLVAVAMGTACSLFLRYKKSNISPNKNGLIPILIFFEREKLESKHRRWELFWELMLVAGLFGGIPFTIHSITEAARLNNENLVLQAKLQPRIITAEQITNFIFLTQYLTKFPVRVEIGEMREETFNYARQIRYILTRAGFQTPDIDTNALEGVFSDPSNVVYPNAIGDTNQWTDVVCFMNFAENYNFHYAKVNGLNLPYADPGDTNQTCEAICFALREDKITLERMGNTNSSKGMQLTIFVRQKPQ